MRALIIPASLALLVIPAAASSLPPISPAQAAANIGACMTVEGHASIFQDSGRPGIDIDLHEKEYDQQLAYGGVPPFTAYVPYPDGFPGLQNFDGKNVAITGIVFLERGIPTIQLSNPEMIAPAGTDPGRVMTCDND